jgi:hypothetical protein
MVYTSAGLSSGVSPLRRQSAAWAGLEWSIMVYSLIIITQTLAAGSIGLFQISDDWERNDVYPVVWISRAIAENGNRTSVIFEWEALLTVACNTTTRHSSVKPLPVATDSVFTEARADPQDRHKKAFMLSYRDSRYQFSEDTPDIDDKKTIILKTDWNVPSASSVSVGVCVDECFICLVKAGPNLAYRINTETEYGLLFGSYREGALLTAEDIKKSLRFSARDFNTRNELTFILRDDNTFTPCDGDFRKAWSNPLLQ